MPGLVHSPEIRDHRHLHHNHSAGHHQEPTAGILEANKTGQVAEPYLLRPPGYTCMATQQRTGVEFWRRVFAEGSPACREYGDRDKTVGH